MRFYIYVTRTDLDGFGHDCGCVAYDNGSTNDYDKFLFFDSEEEAKAWTKSSAAKEWGEDAEFNKYIENPDLTREEAEADWKEVCAPYKGMNHFCDTVDFGSVWEEIEFRCPERQS